MRVAFWSRSFVAITVAATLLLTAGANASVSAAPREKSTSTSRDASERATISAGSGKKAKVTEGRLEAAAMAGVLGSDVITFSEFASGSYVTRQYADRGIVFGGDSPFITGDGSNPSSPVLSGTPTFQGAVSAFFEQAPGALGTVNQLSLDVGYIDQPGSIEVVTYDARGEIIDQVPVSSYGIVRMSISSPGIAAFVVRQATADPAGFAIDNVSFPAVGPVVGVPLSQTFGFGDCNCFGSTGGTQRHTALPVNTATGADTETYTDAALPGLGVPFAMVRTYTSLDTTTGPLGAGWTLPFGARATEAADGSAVTVRAEDGQQAVYVRSADGSYATPPGVRSSLTRTASGWTLRQTDQSTLRFDNAGRLVATKSRLGDGLDLTWSGDELATVTDAAGRTVTFTHTAGLLTRLTLPDGRHADYGYTDGYLTSATSLGGQVTTYAYDAEHRLESARDPNGVYTFRNTYGPDGRVVAQLDGRGQRTTFEWDAASGVATTTDPAGGAWTDVYVANVLVRHIDPLGNSTRIAYDDKLNKVAVSDARGNTTSMTYDDRGNMLTRTAPAPLSYAEKWTYTADNDVATHTDGRGTVDITNTYDSNGLLTKSVDAAGAETRYTYDADGLVRDATDALGGVVSFSYDAAGNRVSETTPSGDRTTRAFDASGRLVSVVEPRGNVAGADTADFRETTVYDSRDLLTRRTDALGRASMFGYDDGGRLVSVTDATGAVTTHAWDGANRETQVTRPDGTTTRTSYDTVGNVVSVSDAAGTTSYTYDLAGRRTSMTDPRGTEPGADAAAYTWTYDHDPNSNVTRSSNPTGGTTTSVFDVLDRPTGRTDALGRTSTTAFDAIDNVTGSSDGAGRSTSATYDAAGRLLTETDAAGGVTTFTYDAVGHRLSSTTPLGAKTTWRYDAAGRIVAETDPRGNVAGANPDDYTKRYTLLPGGLLGAQADQLGQSTTFTYDRAGNVVARRDANAHTTAYGYDALDRVTSVTAPGASTRTSYAYDTVGNLVERTDAAGHVTTYGYDGARRLTDTTDPDGRSWRFAYDAAGNRTRTVTAAGTATPADGDGTVTTSYDALGRLSGIDYSDATSDVGYAYDAMRLTSMTDGAGTETYAYDAADRVTSVTRAGATYAYGYDAGSRVAARNRPDGLAVTYTYDTDGRPRTMKDGNDSTTFTYDVAGNLVSTLTPDGVLEARSIDRAGRVVGVSSTKGRKTVSSSTLTLDGVGNPLSARTQRGTATTTDTFAYDGSDRLTKVCYGASCANGSISYGYDAIGNRLSQARVGVGSPGTTTYSYDATDQLTSATAGSTTAYAYDANGNQTRAGARTSTHDLAGRVVSTTSGATTTAYSYDGNGKRLTRSTNGAVDLRYSWDVNNLLPELATESSGTGAALRRHVTAATGGTLYTKSGAGVISALHHDAFGNVSDVTSSTGAGLWSYAYEPFGSATETKVGSKAAENRIRFAGQYVDTETGQYHLRARQYDPAVGRFTAVDPVAPPLDDPYVSAYVYANNRPSVLSDPSGQCPWCIGAVVGAVAGAVIGGVSYAVTHEGDFSWGGLASSAGKGALVGGIAGATGGLVGGAVAGTALGSLGGAISGGVSGGLAGTAADSLLSGNGLPSPTELAWGGAVGGLFGGGAFGAGAVLSKLCPGIGSALGERGALKNALKNQNVKPGAPQNHLNGAMAEELGWQQALKAGDLPIQGPGKVTTTGPDYVTFDPSTGRIVVWDSKYSGVGKFPAGDSLPQAKLNTWRDAVQKAVDSYSGPDAAAIKEALAKGQVAGKYFKYP